VYVSSHLVLVTHINTGYIPTWNTGTVAFPHTKSFWNVQYTRILIFLIIKPTRCTNFSNIFLEWNSTCFGQLLCPSSRVFHCTHGNGICHTGLLTACEQDQDGTAILILLANCQQTCMTYTIAVCTVKNSWWWTEELSKTCRVSFQNKFEKLVHLVGYIVRNLTRCTVTWTSSIFIYLYM